VVNDKPPRRDAFSQARRVDVLTEIRNFVLGRSDTLQLLFDPPHGLVEEPLLHIQSLRVVQAGNLGANIADEGNSNTRRAFLRVQVAHI